MSCVTSKLQVTIPKAIAVAQGIVPGTEVVFEVAGEVVRMFRDDGKKRPRRAAVAERLRLFDAATARQKIRNRSWGRSAATSARGWTREDLYDRGLPG
jgi:antitoxin component of MazEF toxin-antitoxin module